MKDALNQIREVANSAVERDAEQMADNILNLPPDQQKGAIVATIRYNQAMAASATGQLVAEKAVSGNPSEIISISIGILSMAETLVKERTRFLSYFPNEKRI